ncbi:ABC-2 type transport system permease protein [Ereboglobus sp. PH5-5]|nr:ABC-2 family transporter protein [Ereboglobus sp. PH5-5]MDF9832213.1 ABC-2 type transport system permease protein [Ereboglobus sp. PH5-5]
MIRSLNKYRHVFLVGLQSNLIYRWNFLIRASFSAFHLVVVFMLWSAAYEGKTEIGGFNVAQTMTYFIALMVIRFFISAFNEDYQISEEIRNGLINQFLLKPIDYFIYRLSIFGAARFVSGLLAIVPLLVALPFVRDYVELPFGEGEAWRLYFGLPALAMSAVIQFTIAFCFGMLTFWFLEIQSFVVLSYAIESLLAGQIFPLDLLPRPLFIFSQYLPYYYQMYFPVAILTGRLNDPAGAAQGLMLQFAWMIILLTIARLLWTRGLRRHTAVGG